MGLKIKELFLKKTKKKKKNGKLMGWDRNDIEWQMYWAKVCAEIQTHKPIYNYKYGSLTRQAFSALFSIVNNERTGGTKR